jgi:acyl carrier protein
VTQSIPTDHLSRVFADVFEIPIEHVRPDSSPENIENWDSTRHLSLVVAMEQEFEVQFEPEEIEQLLSFELIYALLAAKLSRNGFSS